MGAGAARAPTLGEARGRRRTARSLRSRQRDIRFHAGSDALSDLRGHRALRAVAPSEVRMVGTAHDVLRLALWIPGLRNREDPRWGADRLRPGNRSALSLLRHGGLPPAPAR